MARPIKKGLDYFSLDTDIESDDKILLIEAKHGIVGFGVILKLLCKIYKNEGYFCSWGESEALLFAKRINVDINSVNAVIKDCLYCEKKFKIFDTEMYERLGILTSRGIQRRYLNACERRKSVEIFREYLLLSLQEINDYKNLVIVDINSINVDINSVNANNVSTPCILDVDISTQSKVKESKVYKKENIKRKKPLKKQIPKRLAMQSL